MAQQAEDYSIYGNMWLAGQVLHGSLWSCSGRFGTYRVVKFSKNRRWVYIKEITHGMTDGKTVRRKIKWDSGKPYVEVGTRIIQRE